MGSIILNAAATGFHSNSFTGLQNASFILLWAYQFWIWIVNMLTNQRWRRVFLWAFYFISMFWLNWLGSHWLLHSFVRNYFFKENTDSFFEAYWPSQPVWFIQTGWLGQPEKMVCTFLFLYLFVCSNVSCFNLCSNLPLISTTHETIHPPTKKGPRMWTFPIRISSPLPTAPHTRIWTNARKIIYFTENFERIHS